MIKKTIMITSLVILIATISVVTTVTMVQADPEAGTTATFGIFPPGGPNPFAGGDAINHDYSHVAASKPLTVLFTNPASLPGGYFDAVEPTFQGTPFTPPAPDTSVTLYLGGFAVTTPFNIVKGHEEAKFSFTGLVPGNQYRVTAIISDMDDFALTTDMASTMPAPETVFVTDSTNAVDLGIMTAVPLGGPSQTITAILPTAAIADAAGTLTIGFNEFLFVGQYMVGELPYYHKLG